MWKLQCGSKCVNGRKNKLKKTLLLLNQPLPCFGNIMQI